MARLAAFRRAQRRAAAAPGLALDQAVVDRIRRVSRKEFPNPEPPQVLDPRAASTLELTCTPTGKSPAGSAAMSGTLSPPVAGATVTLHVTAPDATASTVSTTTDATGAYATTIPTPIPGTFTIFARWPGNPGIRFDDSPSCQTVVS